MKKIIDLKSLAVGVLIGTIASGTISVAAATVVKNLQVTYSVNKVVVDGKPIVFDEASKPFAVDGKTFLPVKALSEALGKEVKWDEATGTITLTSKSKEISTNVTQQDSVVALVNKVRLEKGLKPLKINEELTKLCNLKANDMVDNNYYAHDSKKYGSATDMIENANIEYSVTAENLVHKVGTAEKAMDLWLNSEVHKANILNPKFTETGVGYINRDGQVYWVQMFIGN